MEKIKEKPNKKGKILAIISLILGLVSIEYTIMGFFIQILSSITYIPIICAILSVILGIVSLKYCSKKVAVSCIIIGLLAIIFFIFSYIVYNQAVYVLYK